jgi:very-short-patch-repair endonuclease
MDRLRALAAQRGGVFTRQDALNCGFTPDAIRHALETGRWRALHKGVYVETALFDASTESARHTVLVAAALARLKRHAVASHESTLLLYRVALYRAQIRVALTASSGKNKAYDGFDVLVASLPPAHVTKVADNVIGTCTLARGLADVARRGELRVALVPLESALHRGIVTQDDLEAVLADCSEWPGAAAARDFVEFAEPKSETPAESLSRCMFREQDIEMPESQVWMAIESEVPQYRVDFYWRRWRVIGEVDGRSKYELNPDERWEEKRREERLQDGDHEIVRWSYQDAKERGPATKARILRAFARAARRFGLSG